MPHSVRRAKGMGLYDAANGGCAYEAVRRVNTTNISGVMEGAIRLNSMQLRLLVFVVSAACPRFVVTASFATFL